MYLNGLDTLGRFTGVRGQNARFDKTNNLFSYNRSPNSVEHSSIKYGDGPYRSMYIPNQLGEAIKAKTPMKAFVCVNNDPNNMHMIEFEEMANDGKFTFSVGYNYYGLTIFQKGVNNDNKVIAVFFDKIVIPRSFSKAVLSIIRSANLAFSRKIPLFFTKFQKTILIFIP